MREDYPKETLFNSLIDAIRKYQPAAMLLESTRPRGLLYRHPISLDSSLAPAPRHDRMTRPSRTRL